MSVTHRTVFCRVNVPLERRNSKNAGGQSHRDFSLDQLDQVVGLSTLREGTYITLVSIRKEKQKKLLWGWKNSLSSSHLSLEIV